MIDLAFVINRMDTGNRVEVLSALKILVEHNVLGQVAHTNMNQLVDNRMDSEDEVAIVREVRETRQTNRVLLGLEESARQLTKGI